MTDLIGARDELVAGFDAAGIPMAEALGRATPYGVVYGDGLDSIEHIGRGQVEGRFRVTLIAGAWDAAASARLLTGLVQIAVETIRALMGWRLVEVRRDNIITVGDGQYVGCDVIAARMVDFA